MKYRLSFVTNSSSSSFTIVNISKEKINVSEWLLKNYDDLVRLMMENYYGEQEEAEERLNRECYSN